MSGARCANRVPQGTDNRNLLKSAFRQSTTRRAVEDRPRSTKLFTCVDIYPKTLPSYEYDYGPKPLVHTPCVRSGTSSGTRRNNPHPSEAFMVWRLPSRFPPMELRATTAELNPEELIAQQQLKSTYQDDYTGLQQGQLPPLNGSSSPLRKPPSYSQASSMRQAYQMPKKNVHLQGNTSRYGCSEGFVKPACGVVPTLHPDSIAVMIPNHKETWYNTEFAGTGMDTGTNACRERPHTPVHLPPIILKPQPTRPGPGRTGKAGSKDVTGLVPNSSASARAKRVVNKRIEFLRQAPTWLSEWTGPMM